jgi:hypothetical protein
LISGQGGAIATSPTAAARCTHSPYATSVGISWIVIAGRTTTATLTTKSFGRSAAYALHAAAAGRHIIIIIGIS